MSRLHPDSLSPDPTFGCATRSCGELANELDLEPYRIVRAVPALSEWKPPVRLPAPANGRDAANAPVHYQLQAGIKAQLPAEGAIVERGG